MNSRVPSHIEQKGYSPISFSLTSFLIYSSKLTLGLLLLRLYCVSLHCHLHATGNKGLSPFTSASKTEATLTAPNIFVGEPFSEARKSPTAFMGGLEIKPTVEGCHAQSIKDNSDDDMSAAVKPLGGAGVARGLSNWSQGLALTRLMRIRKR